MFNKWSDWIISKVEFKKYKTNQRWCTNGHIHFFTCNLWWKLWHIFFIAIKGTPKGNGRQAMKAHKHRRQKIRPWSRMFGGGVRLLFYLLPWMLDLEATLCSLHHGQESAILITKICCWSFTCLSIKLFFFSRPKPYKIY